MEDRSKNGHREHSVLLIKDLTDQLDLIDAVLRKAGYRVFCAEDAQTGLDLAGRNRRDLIISDVTMPGIDGIEFTRRVREDQELKMLPILLVSALRKDTASVVEGLEAGADEFLEMPFDSARLVAQASRLIERAQLEEALKVSEERYRLLFDCTPQPIWVYDEETLVFLAVNDAAVNTYGYSREEFLTMATSDIRPWKMCRPY